MDAAPSAQRPAPSHKPPATSHLLQRINGATVVSRAWQGDTVVCAATGPSLTAEQLALVKGRARLIVVNDAYLLAPWADVLYFCDPKWYGWHKDRPEFRAFAGQKCTMLAGKWPPAASGIFALERDVCDGLSEKPDRLRTGANSGHQGINLAALSGARRVLLLGYDFRRGEKGRQHWFGAHPDKSEPPYKQNLHSMRTVPPFARKMGVEIVNCAPGSAIDCFPRAALAEALAGVTRAELARAE